MAWGSFVIHAYSLGLMVFTLFLNILWRELSYFPFILLLVFLSVNYIYSPNIRKIHSAALLYLFIKETFPLEIKIIHYFILLSFIWLRNGIINRVVKNGHIFKIRDILWLSVLLKATQQLEEASGFSCWLFASFCSSFFNHLYSKTFKDLNILWSGVLITLNTPVRTADFNCSAPVVQF